MLLIEHDNICQIPNFGRFKLRGRLFEYSIGFVVLVVLGLGERTEKGVRGGSEGLTATSFNAIFLYLSVSGEDGLAG